MEMLSVLLALCEANPSVTDGFPSHIGPLTKGSDVFFDISLNKLLPWISYDFTAIHSSMSALSHYTDQHWLLLDLDTFSAASASHTSNKPVQNITICDGSVQHCSISSALAMELLRSYTESSISRCTSSLWCWAISNHKADYIIRHTCFNWANIDLESAFNTQ